GVPRTEPGAIVGLHHPVLKLGHPASGILTHSRRTSMRKHARRLVHARLHLDSGAAVPTPAHGPPRFFLDGLGAEVLGRSVAGGTVVSRAVRVRCSNGR